MPADRSAPGARLARRRFLGALAAAPAALAGCATAAPAGARPDRAATDPAPARAPAPDAATAAVREQPLAPDAEPAFVFRASAPRSGAR